jgi:predicted nucleotidyltransferase
VKSKLESLVELLISHGVEFMIIGGQAETIFGSPRVTFDIDLCYRRTPENLKRLAAALREIKPTLRGASPELTFLLDEKALALGNNYTFVTRFGDVDFLGHVEPIGDFDALAKRAKPYPVGGAQVLVIDLDDLIRIKEHINRPKDRDSLFQLRAIKKLGGG